MNNVQTGKFNFNNPVWKNVSSDAQDLINKLLERDTDKRFSAKDALNHKWMKDHENNVLSKSPSANQNALAAFTNLSDF